MDYLGLGKTAFTGWKNGSNRSYFKHIGKIADFFNVSTDYLLGKDKNTDDIPVYDRPEFFGDPENSKHAVDKDAVLRYALFGNNSDDVTPQMLNDVRQFADFLRKQDKDENE